jgi:hypothetical protein
MYLSLIITVINKQIQEEDLKWEYIVSHLCEAVNEYFCSVCVFPAQAMDVLVFSASKLQTYLPGIGFSSCTGPTLNIKHYY